MTCHSHETCSICLDVIDNSFKSNCGHYFHKYCIDKWLNINNTCPICRKSYIIVKEISYNNNSLNINIIIYIIYIIYVIYVIYILVILYYFINQLIF